MKPDWNDLEGLAEFVGRKLDERKAVDAARRGDWELLADLIKNPATIISDLDPATRKLVAKKISEVS